MALPAYLSYIKLIPVIMREVGILLDTILGSAWFAIGFQYFPSLDID